MDVENFYIRLMETRGDGLYYLLDSDPLVTGKQSNPIMDRDKWDKKCNSIPDYVSAGEIVSVFNTFTNKKKNITNGLESVLLTLHHVIQITGPIKIFG